MRLNLPPINVDTVVGLDSIGQVKAAVDAGRVVHWANDRYQVIKDKHDRYLVVWDRGGPQENCVGLQIAEEGDTTMGPSQFYMRAHP